MAQTHPIKWMIITILKKFLKSSAISDGTYNLFNTHSIILLFRYILKSLPKVNNLYKVTAFKSFKNCKGCAPVKLFVYRELIVIKLMGIEEIVSIINQDLIYFIARILREVIIVPFEFSCKVKKLIKISNRKAKSAAISTKCHMISSGVSSMNATRTGVMIAVCITIDIMSIDQMSLKVEWG